MHAPLSEEPSARLDSSITIVSFQAVTPQTRFSELNTGYQRRSSTERGVVPYMGATRRAGHAATDGRMHLDMQDAAAVCSLIQVCGLWR